MYQITIKLRNQLVKIQIHWNHRILRMKSILIYSWFQFSSLIGVFSEVTELISSRTWIRSQDFRSELNLFFSTIPINSIILDLKNEVTIRFSKRIRYQTYLSYHLIKTGWFLEILKEHVLWRTLYTFALHIVTTYIVRNEQILATMLINY